MATTKQIQNHPNYDANDFAYLTAKGGTKAEILTRWNEERAAGNSACRWNGHFAQMKLNAVTAH